MVSPKSISVVIASIALSFFVAGCSSPTFTDRVTVDDKPTPTPPENQQVYIDQPLDVDQSAVLAAVQTEDGFRGYIDRDGEWIIEPQFTQAGSFSHGLAAVTEHPDAQSLPYGTAGGYYWIDLSGGSLYKDPGSDELFYFYNDHSYVFNAQTEKYHRISRAGVKSPDGYDGVIQGFIGPDYLLDGEESGFQDAQGDWLLNDNRDDVAAFNQDYALTLKDEQVRHINTQGSYVYEQSWTTADQFVEGFAGVEQDGLRGFIDLSGAVVIPIEFNDVGQFSEGLAPVQVGELRGFIDTSGAIVVEPQYQIVRGFSEGYAAVFDGSLVGFINTDGEEVLPPQFGLAYDFSQGRALFGSGGLFGYIDKTGSVIIEPQYTNAMSFVDSAEINLLERIQ